MRGELWNINLQNKKEGGDYTVSPGGLVAPSELLKIGMKIFQKMDWKNEGKKKMS